MCVLMCDCPLCPFSPLSPVLAELQQTDLITSEECKGLEYLGDVVQAQSGKSPEAQAKTADVFRRHGFEEESYLLAGKQTQLLIHVPVVCCTVEPSCKSLLKTSFIVPFTHPLLGHGE